MLKSKRPILATLLALTALAVFTALWLRGTKLELYTSPPLLIDGQNVRLQALIPASWTVQSNTVQVYGVGTFPGVKIGPPARQRWLPNWLDRLFHAPKEQLAELSMAVGWNGSYNGAVMTGIWHITGPEELDAYAISRGIEMKPGYYIYYLRGNKPDFDATYRQILDSFKVIR